MPQKYPVDFNIKDLKDKIIEYADHPIEGSILSIAKFTKAMIGLIELQGRENKKITKWTLGIASLALIVSMYGTWLTSRQTEYAAIQSIPERINQARAITKAVERCRQSPELKDSGLFEIPSGKPAPCSQVLQIYGKD